MEVVSDNKFIQTIKYINKDYIVKKKKKKSFEDNTIGNGSSVR